MTDTFPPEYDPKMYLELHQDLIKAGLNEQDLRKHFYEHGKIEGRISNIIYKRSDFLALIAKNVSILEIGPFFNPSVKGKNVKYFDILGYDELVNRANFYGGSTLNIPHIDFVDPKGNLDIVNEQFDVVVSSHCIEHQPDLVDHLQKVEKILKPGGHYFLLIPDKRYCFDHFIPETIMADVLDKYYLQAKTHSLRNVLVHRIFSTHNDPIRHWSGDHGPQHDDDYESHLQSVLSEYNDPNGKYIDVHGSFFTPDTFANIIGQLNKLKLLQLKILRNYHTRKNDFEFFVIMEKPENII